MWVDFLTFIHSAVDGVRNIALLLDGLGRLSSLAPPGALQEFCCIGECFWLVVNKGAPSTFIVGENSSLMLEDVLWDGMELHI